MSISPEEAKATDSLMSAVTIEVSKMTLTVGDILVIKSPVKLSRLQEERVRRQVRDTLPLNGAKCLVLHSGMDIAVVKEA